MMRFWLDTEFNGYGGELLSVALVSESLREFYRVLPWKHLALDPWVAAHVVPVLGCDPVPVGDAQTGLCAFLKRYDAVHIVADWPDDIAYLCRLLLTGPGTRIDTPPLTFEVIRIDSQGTTPHNALSDALALRRVVFALEQGARKPEPSGRHGLKAL